MYGNGQKQNAYAIVKLEIPIWLMYPERHPDYNEISSFEVVQIHWNAPSAIYKNHGFQVKFHYS